MINSALVSAQNRQRYYWTNFEVTQPEDKGVLLRDIIEDLSFNEIMPENVEFKENYAQWDINNKGNKSQDQRAYYADGKHGTLPANGGGSKVKVCLGQTFVDRGKFGLIAKVGNVNPSGRGMNGNVYHVDAKSPTLTTNKGEGIKITGGAIRGRYLVDGKRQDHKMKTAGLTEQRLEVRKDEKTNTLTTVQKDNVVVFKDKSQTLLATIYKENAKSMVKRNKMGLCVSDSNKTEYVESGIHYRKLTPLECERLQTFPDGWTDCISNTHRYKSLGNAWTVDVIAHVLQCGFKS